GLIETLILAFFSARVLQGISGTVPAPAELLRQFAVLTALPLFWIVGERLSESPYELVTAGGTLLLLLLSWEWNFLLRASDRTLVVNRLRVAKMRLRGISS
ncbi:MAG: hypothetical protein KDA79_17330, partial [Planctomycetaceae bacterium]|nr:hypothetical protein [Planctomycetaceae bacterium]